MNAPLCDTHEFHARKATYALVTGVYNEGARFTRQLEELQAYRGMVDIIVADGGSSDGATSPQALKDKVRTLLINTDAQRGLSVQYRSALKYALDQGYEGVIMVDGNGKDGIDAIPRFIEKLTQGYDFVQGSRFMQGGVHKNTPLVRVLGIRLVFNPVMALATGTCYSDTMNGFKAVSRRFLTHPLLQPFRSIFVRYGLQYYLNYRAAELGVRLCEIPVSRIYIRSNTPHSKIVGIKAYLGILRELLNTVTGRYNPR